VMSAYIVTEASITVPLLGKNLDQAGIIAHPEIAGALRGAIQEFVNAIQARRA
jgi:chromate reductase, NAD(P)H dehydrogenase (quinone)